MTILLKDDPTFEYNGLLASVSRQPNDLVEVSLKDVVKRTQNSNKIIELMGKFVANNAEIKKLILSKKQTLREHFRKQEEEATNSNSSFETDTRISNKPTRRTKPGNKDRSLRKWTEHSNTSLEQSLESPHNQSNWDQFATNERLFGVKTTYDENLYTIAIDKTSQDYLKLEKEAGKIASEIMSGRKESVHSDHEVDYSDEEEKFSSVIRHEEEKISNSLRNPQVSALSSGSVKDDKNSDTADGIPSIADEKKESKLQLNPFAKEFVPSQPSNTYHSQSYSTSGYSRNSHQFPQPCAYYGTLYYPLPYVYSGQPANFNSQMGQGNYAQFDSSQSFNNESSDSAIIVSISSSNNNTSENLDSSQAENANKK